MQSIGIVYKNLKNMQNRNKLEKYVDNWIKQGIINERICITCNFIERNKLR